MVDVRSLTVPTMTLVSIAEDLREAVRTLAFGPPVSHVYSPLDYAWPAHRAYLERFGSAPKEVVLVGMNPGPWGMAQTGVPFGEVAAARGWLGISAPVGRPEREHPARPVTGFACTRSEVSGRRVWGWARELSGTAGRFFERFFIANYCPLLFLETSGRNLTPDRLPAAERRPLEAVCDAALARSIGLLEPQIVLGFGTFATRSAARALAGTGVRVEQVLHPSPASPAANRGWSEQLMRRLSELGVAPP
jgi:single-strand selective monofunctional uracil DNA glycosylase